MDRQQLIAYLDRIGLSEEPVRDIAGIGMMQRAHLETVPFENLDILAGKVPLDLSEAGLFDKIVRRRRGGICYELNFLSTLRPCMLSVSTSSSGAGASTMTGMSSTTSSSW